MSAAVPELTPVLTAELLARFVLFSRWIRSDGTVRADALVPWPWPELSVTRHRALAVSELWELGQDVADQRPATLYGRADVVAADVMRHSLRVEPTHEPKNHANIVGWPVDKPAQKMIAQEIASRATYVPFPGKTP